MSDESAPDQDTYTGPAAKRRNVAEWFMDLVVGGPPWLWKRTPKSFEDARKFSFNTVLVTAGLLLAVVLINATTEKITIVEAIAVPKVLEDRGYGGTIMAQRLIDQVHVISTTAKTAKQRVEFGRESHFAALSTLQLPATSLTLQSVVAMLRNLFGEEDRKISGEITIKSSGGTWSPPPVYSLLLRFDTGKTRAVHQEESTDLDDLMRRASLRVLRQWDPQVLASYFYTLRKWDEVDKLLDRLEVSPDPHVAKWALNLRGNRQADRGNYEKALQYYQRAIDQDPKFASAISNSGNALSSQGKYDEAIEKYLAAINLDLNLALAHVGWAYALAKKKDVKAALWRLDVAISLNPEGAASHRAMGDILVNSDDPDYDKAIESYRIAVGLEPNYAGAYVNWGSALQKKGDHEGALTQYAKAAEANPHMPHPHYGAARILSGQGKHDEAIKRYLKAVDVDSEYWLALDALGDEFARKGDYARAKKKWQQVMQVHPETLFPFPLAKIERMTVELTGVGLPF